MNNFVVSKKFFLNVIGEGKVNFIYNKVDIVKLIVGNFFWWFLIYFISLWSFVIFMCGGFMVLWVDETCLIFINV